MTRSISTGKKIKYMDRKLVAIKELGEDKWKKTTLVVFKDILKHFNKDSIYPLTLYGTLLGIARDNDVICGDDDIDFIADYKDWDKILASVKNFVEKNDDYEYFSSKGYGYLWPTSITIWKKSIPVNVDIDFYSVKEKTVNLHVNNYFMLWKYGYDVIFKKDDIFPLKKKKFLGGTLMIPNKYENILQKFYGESWRIPYIKCQKTKKKLCGNCVVNPEYKAFKKGDKMKFKRRVENIKGWKKIKTPTGRGFPPGKEKIGEIKIGTDGELYKVNENKRWEKL